MHILPLISYLLVDVRSKSTEDATHVDRRERSRSTDRERRERGGEIDLDLYLDLEGLVQVRGAKFAQYMKLSCLNKLK